MQDVQSWDLWCAEKSSFPRCQDLPGIQGVITMSIYVLCFGRLNLCTWVNVLDHACVKFRYYKGQHPRRELYGHGNVLFRCSFQDTIDLYRSSDLHIVCIYTQFISIYGCSGFLIFFWNLLDISKHLQASPSKNGPRRAASTSCCSVSDSDLGKSCSRVVSRIADRFSSMDGTGNLETPWSLMMGERWWTIFTLW